MSTYDDVDREARADRRNDDIEPWYHDYVEEYAEAPLFDHDDTPASVYEMAEGDPF